MVSTQAGHLLETRNEDVHKKGGFWSQSPPGPPGSPARQSARGSALQDMTGLAREGKRRALPLPLHTLLLLCFHTAEEMCIFKYVLAAAGVTEGAMHTSGVGIGTFPICWGHFCF